MSVPLDPPRKRLYELVARAATLHGVNTGEAGNEVGDLQEAVVVLLSQVPDRQLESVEELLAVQMTDWAEASKPDPQKVTVYAGWTVESLGDSRQGGQARDEKGVAHPLCFSCGHPRDRHEHVPGPPPRRTAAPARSSAPGPRPTTRSTTRVTCRGRATGCSSPGRPAAAWPR